jgi:hypothetical protein
MWQSWPKNCVDTGDSESLHTFGAALAAMVGTNHYGAQVANCQTLFTSFEFPTEGLRVGRRFGEFPSFTQSLQIFFIQVFNLEKGERISGGYLEIIPSNTWLVNTLLGIFRDPRQSPPITYTVHFRYTRSKQGLILTHILSPPRH